MRVKVLEGFALFISLFFALITWALLIQFIGGNDNNKATIIAGALGMIGGFAGAMGAYFAARHQINNENKQSRIRLLHTELPVYISLSIEFEKIIAQLKSLKKFKDNNEDNANDEFIINFTAGLDALKWDKWVDNKRISDSVLLKELFMFEESFKRTLEVFEYNINYREEKASELITQNKLAEAGMLAHEIDIIKKDKIHYWKEIDHCLTKANKLNKVILAKARSIEDVFEGKLDINNFQYYSSKDEFKVLRHS